MKVVSLRKIFLYLISVLCTLMICTLEPKYSLLLSCSFLLVILLVFETRKYIYFTFVYILAFPKVNVINVPGTYIGIRGEDFLLGLLFVFLILKSIVYKKTSVNSEYNAIKLSNSIALYIMACVFSVLWGMHAGYLSNYLLGFLFLFRKVEYVLMCILAYQLIRDRDNGKTIIKIIDRTLPILMIIGFLQLTGHVGGFIQGYYAPDVSWRIPSTFSGPYEYSAYLVLITPIYLYRLIYNRKVLSSLIVLPMIFVSLYFTQARISIVAFGVILLLFFMFSRRMLYRSISISVIVIGCIFFLLSQSSSLSSILPERFSTVNISDMVLQTKIAMKQADFDRFLEYGYTVYNVGDDMSFSMRIGKWADMLDGFSRSPILGVGLSVTTEAVDGNYIRYLAESGILGFSLWLILIYRILKISKSIKTANKDLLLMKNAVFFGTFGLLVMAIFIDIFEASKIAMIYWFFIGVLIKLNSLQNEEERA